ncbi:fumarylacetoacetate hydrolase family protein [Nocardia sp. NPDC055053]
MSWSTGSVVDWSAGLGLARTVYYDRPVVVLRRNGCTEAHTALVDGQAFADLPELLEAAAGNYESVRAGKLLQVPDEALEPPVGRPRKIICVGLNYGLHAREAGRPHPGHPELFPKWDNCLTRPYSEIALPQESSQIDFEAELVAVVGRRGRRVPTEHAESILFGYTAANDGSVRDFQRHAQQVVPGKAWDGLTPIGPVVVPASQLGGARPNLTITGILDGQVVQNDQTKNMFFGIPELISYLTTIMTLEPGDLLFTGTPAGVGFARTPPTFLRDGSVFEVQIEGIGSLRTRYADEPAQLPSLNVAIGVRASLA